LVVKSHFFSVYFVPTQLNRDFIPNEVAEVLNIEKSLRKKFSVMKNQFHTHPQKNLSLKFDMVKVR